jgi:hypothetical protein
VSTLKRIVASSLPVAIPVALLLLVGVLLALLFWFLMDMQSEILLVVLVFVPLVVVTIFRGGLRELSFSPQGFTVRLDEVAKEPVRPYPGKIDIPPSIDDLQEVQKLGALGFSRLEEMLATYGLSEARPIVMIMKLGQVDDPYPRQATLNFIQQLSRYRSFKFVLFMDADDKIFGYMPSWKARQILSQPDRAERFLGIVNRSGNHSELDDFNVIREYIAEDDTNTQALQKMSDRNLDALVVVDRDGQVKGVIERENVISKIILKLLEDQDQET